MTGEIRPDDLARSPSGRVPKWVLDEARGLAPTELVPFRGATATPPGQPDRAPSRVKRWTKVTAAVLLLGGAVWLADAKGVSTDGGLSAGRSPLTASPDSPPPGLEEKDHALGEPAPLTGSPSTSYRFLGHQQDKDAPIAWSPCRPIHYVVRPEHAPPEGPQLIQNGFARLSAATGLVFVDDGATTEAPSEGREPYQKDRYGDRWAPVLVTWATADEVPDFGIDVAGEAGSIWLNTVSGDRTPVSGIVHLDAAWFSKALRAGDAVQPQAIVLHELGHLVGLAHVNDPDQIMFPRAGSARRDYGAGDLAGLAELGRGSCQPDI